NVTETARLLTVAVNRKRTTGERLFHEGRYYHPVTAGLSWPHGIEESDDGGRQFLFAPVSERQKLVNRFRAGVAPTSFCRRAHNEVAVFLKSNVGAQSINLRGRRDQDPLLFLI